MALVFAGGSARANQSQSAPTLVTLTVPSTGSPGVASASAVVQVGAPSPTPSSAPTSAASSGLLTRAEAIAKAPPPLGDTVTRLEAKLVLRTDLAAAEKGIGGIRPHVDYVWVVARSGQFTPRRFGAPLFRDTQQQSQLPPSPDGWRFLLIDARTGEALCRRCKR
jgi:hypothetical protein